MTGRPSKLTPEVHEAIVTAVREGLPPTSAARLAGISNASHFEWLARGKLDNEADRESIFATYERELRRAEAAFQLECIRAARGFEDASTAREARNLMVVRWPRLYSPASVSIDAERRALIDTLEREFANEPSTLRRIFEAIAGADGNEPTRRPAQLGANVVALPRSSG